MDRKTLTSLNEAALQVQHGTTPEPEVNDMVLEYFENYFGGSLNESISDEDIMEAVYDLVDLTEAVCEATGVQKLTRAVFGKQIAKHRARKHDKESQRLNRHGGDLAYPGGGHYIPKGLPSLHPPEGADEATKKELKSVIHSRGINRTASRRYKNIAKGKKPFDTEAR